jgi:hypothetical protein
MARSVKALGVRAGLLLAACLTGCAPPPAPPPPCTGANCSFGTPRYDPGGGTSADSGAALDAMTVDGALDAMPRDASTATDAAAPLRAVRGAIGDARILPRTRPMDTAPASGWSVRSLLAPMGDRVLTDVGGAFALTAPLDERGEAPLLATDPGGARCVIGTVSPASPSVIASPSAMVLLDALAASRLAPDPLLAHVVLEVTAADGARARDVRVTQEGGAPLAVAYDVAGATFALTDATGPAGTAVIANITSTPGPAAEPVLVAVRITLGARSRVVPLYVARGCVTFAGVSAP